MLKHRFVDDACLLCAGVRISESDSSSKALNGGNFPQGGKRNDGLNQQTKNEQT